MLVQHLDPKHHSILTEMLDRKTAMSVTEVSEGLTVKCNHFYVSPPNASMSISEDTLHLGPREESRGLHMPVVNFMRSLAEQKGNRAIGVIMSGSDGTLGMAEIQAHGGVTLRKTKRRPSITACREAWWWRAAWTTCFLPKESPGR